MKRILYIPISIIIFVLVFLLLTPTIHISHAQDCTSDPSVCGPDQTCEDINGEGKRFECYTPPPPLGSTCKTSEDKCAINQICSPNSTGSEDGTCKEVSEGTACNPNLKMPDGRSAACGSHVTSQYECKPDAAKGINTCQRIGCDILEVGQACKDKISYYCVDGGNGTAACKFLPYPPPLPPSPNAPCIKNGFDPITKKCNYFHTGLGIISTDPARFIRSLFAILLAASGSIALLLIIRAGYKILTSQGKPEAIQEGREKLVAAIVGLLFLIFALVFLQIIGFDLLRIPGISGSSSPSGGSSPSTSIGSPATDPSGNPITGSPTSGTPNSQQALPKIADCSSQLLRSGNSGDCVKVLQQKLGGLTVDGNFNTLTDASVKKFQADNGIFIDGTVGPCTWGKLMSKSIKPICAGPLNDATIRQFQTENNLVVNGVLSGTSASCTWNAIMGDPIPESCKRK